MRLAAPLLAALGLALTGCLQVEEALTVHADGSGKIVLQVALRTSMLKLMEQGAQQEGLPPGALRAEMSDPSKLLGQAQGIVAVTGVPAVEDGEWFRTGATAYFDDINRVRMASAREGTSTTFSARLSPGTLSLTNRLGEIAGGFEKGFRKRAAERGADPEQIKASLEFLKPMMDGLRIRIAVTGPAALTEAEGFASKDGATASSTVGPDLFLALLTEPEGEKARRFKAMVARPDARIRWSAGDAPSAAPDAFKAELAAARSRGGRAPEPSPAPGPNAPVAPSKPRSLGEDAKDLTDDEVERLFIEAQIKVARSDLERGRKDKARETLQGVIRDYPKAKAALEAKKLLESIK